VCTIIISVVVIATQAVYRELEALLSARARTLLESRVGDTVTDDNRKRKRDDDDDDDSNDPANASTLRVAGGSVCVCVVIIAFDKCVVVAASLSGVRALVCCAYVRDTSPIYLRLCFRRKVCST
jgi:hypothetical protein